MNIPLGWLIVGYLSSEVANECHAANHVYTFPATFAPKHEGQWADTDDLGWRSGGNLWSEQAFDSRRGSCCAQGGRFKALYAEGRYKVAIPWKDVKPPLYCNTQILLDAMAERYWEILPGDGSKWIQGLHQDSGARRNWWWPNWKLGTYLIFLYWEKTKGLPKGG